MFYSHEILTSRKHGVATVWLVATLGAKSNTKKVTRKAILDVDVQKACDTIIQPDAPMALRLQSNLLYGVSRVYDQQCGYVLHDAQVAQTNMRALLKIIKSHDIDATVTKAHPEQLMILDDPAFNPDNALPALDFDFPSIILAPANDSQRSTQSMMSIAPSRSASISSHTASIGINLPSSSTHNAYQLPSNSHFDPSSAVKGTGRSVLDDEADLFQDDMVFEFDENGEMRDIPDDEQARRASRLGSDSAASRRVRKEHDDAAAVTGRVRDMLDSDGDFDMAHFGEGSILPDAEAFPTSAAMMSGGLGLHDDNDSRPALDAKDRVYSEEPPSSDSAEAPQKRSRLKAKKVVLGIDRATELGGRDLLLWQREYGDNMTAGRLLKADKRGKTVAKKNAWVFVWESGLNGVGCGVGFESVRSPLDMFAGGRLFETVTGRALVDEGLSKPKKSTKHALASSSPSPKRPRLTPELGRDADHDLAMIDFNNDNDLPELGRDAPSALPDAPSSAIMPWNLSASLHSQQRSHASSTHAHSQGPTRNHNRNASASPLIGRGSALPSPFHVDVDEQDEILYGRSDAGSAHNQNDDGDDGFVHERTSSEFELHGAAANVDTQTAASSQWVRAVLEKDSGNFWAFVRGFVVERYQLIDAHDNEQGVDGKEVLFEELFEPERNSAAVAAQAFYHVLCLASKGKLGVRQEVGRVEEWGAFGEIGISVVV